MTILDRVYEQFSNLEEDFSKSGKTRTEFITEKFGGDINTGSVIILDAIHSEALELGLDEDPDYIEKTSFIKDVFSKLASCAGTLDQLSSFNMEDIGMFDRLMLLLLSSYNSGAMQNIEGQRDMWQSENKALHYISSSDGMSYCPPDLCTVLRAYNENMITLMSSSFHPETKVNLDEFYLRKAGDRLHRIMKPAVAKNLR